MVPHTVFLGIDESNHGRFPEVLVGAKSNSLQEAAPSQRELTKNRSKVNKIPPLGKREYRHVLIPEEWSGYWGRREMKIVAISELILWANKGEYLQKVLIDGFMNGSDLEMIMRCVHPFTPKIEAIEKGDQRYPLINTADTIAHGLFRYYSTSKNHHNRLKYLPALITPPVEKYRPLLLGR